MLIFIPLVSVNAEGLYTYGNTEIAQTRINMQSVGGENVIFMPSSSSAEKFCLFGDFPEKSSLFIKKGNENIPFSSGMEINLNDFETDEIYTLYFTDKKGAVTDFSVKILFSDNIPSVYIVSDNPAEKGREWVEKSPDKSNKATALMVMLNENGETVYNGALTQIKGRGNSTWGQVKKPYQIKLSEKTDLLSTGNSENKSKTWVLLANYLDPSLLNNSTVLGLGKEIGMKTNIESTHADLYYDGEYRGSYLLSEKVEVGKGRVDIFNLEEQNAELNGEKEEYPIKTATTKNGAEYTYCDTMISPEDVTGGYLLEMDYEVRAKEEICYFKTTRNQYVVVKSPELASKEEMDYIATLYQAYEDAVFNGGVNPSTGKAYSDYVDRESVAIYYLMNEFSKARDFFGSSAYLYKDKGEDKMYMGPLWDYDLGFGKSRYERNEEEPPFGENIYNTMFGRKLLGIKDFAELLNEKYEKELYPLIMNVILGDESKISESGGIHSVLYEKNRLLKTAEFNNLLWYKGKNTQDDVNQFYNFISARAGFLKDAFKSYIERESGREDLYGDVPKERWFYDAVMDVTAKGYMKNVYNTFFDPYSKVKRVEATEALFLVSGEEAPEFKKMYSDINEDDYYSPLPVIWASEKGIINGYPDGSFNPYGFVSREELVTILYRYKKSPEVKEDHIGKFADAEDVSSYAKDAFNWAVSEKIIQGDDNNRLNPEKTLTRAELATILTRLK